MHDSKQIDSKDDWHTNEDKRVQCLQIKWVATLNTLTYFSAVTVKKYYFKLG
jgi:hypothetical protein